MATPITVAYGDGIGPEIMGATLRILAEAGARLAPEVIEIGEQVYKRGVTAGIEDTSWDSLRRTQVFLKAPITTPSGGGYKSLNVTVRKTMGLFANVRPCVAYHPFVATNHPGMDLVIVRENEEDLYAGIEHRQTDDVVQCLKLISRPGCERIARYAFEYARRNGRKKVTCMTKDNIMKMTDGLFRRVFEEIGADYPEIAKDHMIIDIGTAMVADKPDSFDVIVTPNLYGDILSDVAAQVTGSVGLGGSANIGDSIAMFEAIHGSAPMIAGKGIANPSGLLLAAVMMLVHIRQPEAATAVHNAWLRTIEDGIHTADIASARTVRKVGTDGFAAAVIDRLGQSPVRLSPVAYANPPEVSNHAQITLPRRKAAKAMVGVDLFFHWDEGAGDLAQRINTVTNGALTLQMITNRGVKVWPNGAPETFCTDHWRARFLDSNGDGAVTHPEIIDLLRRVTEGGLDVVKSEALCTFDGQPGYSLGQGQ
ncbi:MAG: NADP-dependent isocitrate dehydrogenase [Alphaproteobacteria bacterium]|nr:NADP-dependent isocitrate dehydrogenase [Alphaproteobacteria bacterium]